ncbi:DUF4189 domain-containing protein [Rhizobium sp. MHM7A]|uniref:DUF4189 domain-containing protein n=1 Tax=Rhizobium sp. MHM7A TaxID=2583233 RepID=UPI0032B17222
MRRHRLVLCLWQQRRRQTVARRNRDDSANDCRIAIWFRNGCAAVAVGYRGGWGSGWGYDRPAPSDQQLQQADRRLPHHPLAVLERGISRRGLKTTAAIAAKSCAEVLNKAHASGGS